MKNLLLSICSFILFIGALSAQSYTGTVVDNDTGEPLIGAAVSIKGQNVGTLTDVNGKFSLNAAQGDVLMVDYLGYSSKEITLGASAKLGNVLLRPESFGLAEVVVVGNVDIARDRVTPVAVSNIRLIDIQDKSGNTEFPETMKNTPSIYVSNQNGGFGDSQVFTRGFDQTNTAFLLNGQPINGMEDGRMYWSNWSGMADVANAIQVQRGLGSSKLAISSVGGTTNIVMKTTDAQQGGWAKLTYGNDNFIKGTVAYNTGLMNGKFGVSALLTHWQGDGWADGTKGQGQSYFLSMGYLANESHSFNFLLTGAPQWHDQNFTKRISQFEDENGDLNLRYNSNWGTLDGEYMTERRNYYHKPVANMNWNWKMSESRSLSTTLYGSWGRGGGTGNLGSRIRTDEGLVDFDAIQAKNDTIASGAASYILRASANNHAWYGVVSTYEHTINENLSFSFGADLRTYKGTHFRQVVDLLGADFWSDSGHIRYPNHQVSNTYAADPWAALFTPIPEEDRIAYDYDERISYGGVFGQLEYVNGPLSSFVQGAASMQSHIRWDRYGYSEAEEQSETITNPGFNIKAGANYNINASNGVFLNAGYYSRQPFHDNLYLNFGNTVNEVAENEDVIGVELGYRFRSDLMDLNVNLYNTSWNNRVETRSVFAGDSITLSDGTGYVFDEDGWQNQANINQLHRGLEIDARVRATSTFTLKGYASVGDWKYNGNASVKYYDANRDLVDEQENIYIDGAAVGGSAQTSVGIGFDFEIIQGLKIDADYNYYDRLYAQVGPTDSGFQKADNDGVIELPAFGLLDAGLTYRRAMGNGQVAKLRFNVYNALNSTYISYATSNVAPSANEDENWEGVNKSNFVQFGKGLTWNVSLRYSF